MQKYDVQMTECDLVFRGEDEHYRYNITEKLYGLVDRLKSGKNKKGSWLELWLRKKNPEEPWWPRLYKKEGKPAYLKTDWEKWKDEDEFKDYIEGDFDPDKLIDIMKKNGEWDEDEYGPENMPD